jgi:hypothetical protein
VTSQLRTGKSLTFFTVYDISVPSVPSVIKIIICAFSLYKHNVVLRTLSERIVLSENITEKTKLKTHYAFIGKEGNFCKMVDNQEIFKRVQHQR